MQVENEVLPGEVCPTCNQRKISPSFKWKVDNQNGSDTSYVTASRVRFVFQEIVWRIGISEAARRIPLQRATLRKVLDPEKYHKPFVQRKTAAKAIELLRDLRESDEVLSRDSIRRGALQRNEKPKSPSDIRDYNNPSFDIETTNKREYRKRERDKLRSDSDSR